MRDKLITQDAKCEIFRMYWNRVLFSFMRKSIQLKDDNMKHMIEQILKVPLAITDEAIKRFVKKCKEKHAIAFMQWRIFYSRSTTELKDM